LHRKDAPSQGGEQFEGLESDAEVAQEIHLDHREMQGVGKPGSLDGIQKLWLEEGLGSIKLEARANRQPKEAPDFRSARNQLSETRENLVVGFNHSLGLLTKPSLHVRAEL
jgi:hypothetical protein